MPRIAHYFSFFVVLSLLLHMVTLALLQPQEGSRLPARETPFTVDLRPLETKPRELDLPVRETPPRTTAARRLGPQDQVVPRETAPGGDAHHDASPLVPPPRQPEARSKTGTDRPPPVIPDFNPFTAGEKSAASIAALDPALKNRLRDDVEHGNAVWLDTERDLLGSFYKRFRDGIYGVWNYPAEASRRGEQGVALIRIVINRAGLVEQAQILTSSGYRALDDAAVRAIHEASPRFGYLPSAYPAETLTIFAFFEYRIGGGPSIYGRGDYRN